MSGLEGDGIPFWESQAQLIIPELASFVDYGWEYTAPSAMEGHVVEPRQLDDEEAEFMELLISAMAAHRAVHLTSPAA